MTHRIGLEQRVGEPGEGTGVGVRDDLHAVQRDRLWQPDYAGLPARRQVAGGTLCAARNRRTK